MKKIALVSLAALAGMTAAAPAMAQEAVATTAVAAPASDFEPITTKSGTIGAPPAGKAQIVFWRPGTFIGAALGCTVREGEGTEEVQIARLGSGKYWVHVAEPGKHTYWTTGEATDKLNMELEPDETYYVRCAIGMGVMSGRAQVSPSDRATFVSRAKKMKIWEKKDDKEEKK
ncbi:hypothetical protein P1X14_16750 [Sphingomonas sp. AOB5]|uniref:hypothetical protein n=1 Tax=Sphingomonas sp. AOB5 TaxID=3034017 RepID=UPI0023F932FA|nr:hypothetical protein [Sphingomonas sp. AOB5]MDF7776909.1 hypothetical protein [Sphingomonas sp. AOB5]